MKKKYICFSSKIMALILCISIIPAGCSTARKPAPAPYTPYQVTVSPGVGVSPTTPVIPNIPSATAAPSPTPQATLDAPPELERMRVTSINMISSILSMDWDRVSTLYDNLSKDWNSYKVKAASANMGAIQIGSFSTDMAGLSRAVSQKKQYEAALAANRTMMGAVNFMKLYRSTIPFEIGELEYYERNVLLTSQNRDWIRAKAACDSAFSVWSNLKVRATAVSTARSRIYTDTLIKLGNAVNKQDAKQTKKYAERILTENEAMRKDFAR